MQKLHVAERAAGTLDVGFQEEHGFAVANTLLGTHAKYFGKQLSDVLANLPGKVLLEAVE